MPTDNLNLNLPEQGAQDWHLPINENFEILERHNTIQVPSVQQLRDNWTPHDETFAFIENTREFYSGTGEGWSFVGYVKQTPHELYVQETEPESAVEGDIWIVP